MIKVINTDEEVRIKGVHKMLKNEYFTKDEIIEAMENAEEYSADDFDELLSDLFDGDYYIIGTYEASEALATYKNDEELDGYKTDLDGVFGAIELVKQYELEQFGEVFTPLEDPEKLASGVEYIRGENLFNEALNKAGLDMDSETTEENLKKFVEAAKRL